MDEALLKIFIEIRLMNPPEGSQKEGTQLFSLCSVLKLNFNALF